jgi:hypothetical protein
MAEWQILQNPIGVGGIHHATGPEAATASGVLGLQQVPFPGARTHDLAPGGYFEALGDRFLCFDAFGTSHIFSNPFAFQKGREI